MEDLTLSSNLSRNSKSQSHKVLEEIPENEITTTDQQQVSYISQHLQQELMYSFQD